RGLATRTGASARWWNPRCALRSAAVACCDSAAPPFGRPGRGRPGVVPARARPPADPAARSRSTLAGVLRGGRTALHRPGPGATRRHGRDRRLQRGARAGAAARVLDRGAVATTTGAALRPGDAPRRPVGFLQPR